MEITNTIFWTNEAQEMEKGATIELLLVGFILTQCESLLGELKSKPSPEVVVTGSKFYLQPWLHKQ